MLAWAPAARAEVAVEARHLARPSLGPASWRALGRTGSTIARGVGPGIYDIHSPRIPSAAELQELLAAAVAHVPVRQLWVNPDCGLKTRAYPETKASLENLVQAARAVRASLVDSLAG